MPRIRKKSPIHENADANITCDFGDGDISRSKSRFTHTHIASSIIVRYSKSHDAFDAQQLDQLDKTIEM